MIPFLLLSILFMLVHVKCISKLLHIFGVETFALLKISNRPLILTIGSKHGR